MKPFFIDLNDEVIELAKNLVIRYPLRAYDAIQLASAIGMHVSFDKHGLPSLTFISADNRSLNAADQENLPWDNPNKHP